MKILDTMPFAAELLGPLHQQSYRRPGAAAGPAELALDPTWALEVTSAGPVVTRAAEHLRGFLAGSLGLPLAPTGDRTIRLVVDPALGGDGETHRLRISPGTIEVAGAAPAGVLHGACRLIALLQERGGPFLPVGEWTRRPLFRHRIHRSPLSPFYVDELTGYDGPPLDARWLSPGMAYPGFAESDAGPDQYYHDHLLLRLAQHGFNGFWVRGALRLFAKVEPFPEFGADSDRILERLHRLTERAAGFGLQVFLYLNEPMGMRADDPFWQQHPQVYGSESRYRPMVHLCSSTPEVKAYLRDGTRYVFEHVPALAGVMLITASEFPSHCYVHVQRPDDPAQQQRLLAEKRLCPRCLPRSPQEVIGEIVSLIGEGARAANPAAETIAWNWSWSAYEPDPQRGVLERLPEHAIVMGDFERGEPSSASGFDYSNDEYSLKVVGPSQRFRGVAEFQRERGRPVYAKIQIGTTHENPNTPYLPVLHKIGEKYHALHQAGVTGMMCCWNFGNLPSLATEVAGEFSWDPQPAVADGLRALAARHFGAAVADLVVAGWAKLSEAQNSFPGSIPVMYQGPISRAPAFRFEFDRLDQPFPNSWLLDANPRGDRLVGWTSPFGPAKVSACFRAVVATWGEGVALLRQALAQTTGDDRLRLERELGVAEMCRLQLDCSANLIDFLLARDEYLEATDPARRRELLDQMEAIGRDEQQAAAAAMPLCDADPRLGWHGEAYGYMISRELIQQKLDHLAEVLDQRIPAERARLG